jgi:hypothetical protein
MEATVSGIVLMLLGPVSCQYSGDFVAMAPSRRGDSSCCNQTHCVGRITSGIARKRASDFWLYAGLSAFRQGLGSVTYGLAVALRFKQRGLSVRKTR